MSGRIMPGLSGASISRSHSRRKPSTISLPSASATAPLVRLQSRYPPIDPRRYLFLHLRLHALPLVRIEMRLFIPSVWRGRQSSFSFLCILNHLLRRFNACALKRSQNAQPLFNFRANPFGAPCRVHVYCQAPAGYFQMAQDSVVPGLVHRIAFFYFYPIEFRAPQSALTIHLGTLKQIFFRLAPSQSGQRVEGNLRRSNLKSQRV